MRTSLIILLAASLALSASAQILQPGDSATLFTDPPDSSIAGWGSLGWTADPIKDVAWFQPSPPTAFAYVVRNSTGLVVEPMDDFVVPFGGGMMWQEGSNLPEQVWLRVYLTDAVLAVGDPIGAYAVRSVRFGFDRPGAGPFEVPEPGTWGLIAALGLVGFGLVRRSIR
jgi:hypothetical protein